MGRVLKAYFLFVILCIVGVFYFGSASGRSIHEPARNVNGYGGFIGAVTAVGANDANLLITDIQNIPSGNSVTVSPNTQITFTPGSGISVHSGASLYYYGSIIAGPYRIIFGSGDSIFGVNATKGPFYDGWRDDASSATGYGFGGEPRDGYKFDVTGKMGATDITGSFSGSLPFTDLTGQATNAQLPDPVTSGVSTVQPIVAGVSIYNITTSQTLTREMTGGAFIGNYGAISEVTLWGLPAIKGMTYNVSLDQDQTSGSTIWYVVNAADTIINKPGFVTGSGASAIKLSGTTGAGSFTFKAVADNVLRIYEEGTVSYVSIN